MKKQKTLSERQSNRYLFITLVIVIVLAIIIEYGYLFIK